MFSPYSEEFEVPDSTLRPCDFDLVTEPTFLEVDPGAPVADLLIPYASVHVQMNRRVRTAHVHHVFPPDFQADQDLDHHDRPVASFSSAANTSLSPATATATATATISAAIIVAQTASIADARLVHNGCRADDARRGTLEGEPGALTAPVEPPPKKKGRTNTPWTAEEEQRLKIMRDAGRSWSEIAKTFPTRTEGSVKKHWYKDMHYAEFTDDESVKLREAIKEYEANKWKVIGQKVGKPAKACEQFSKEHFKNL
ncbi:hypothetical protein N7492_009013 [Penicillium capsulatum]|uniref:MYB DNA-binding domain protein n=1 Tax=Penicillium capsulatum TaxID=69766 RepID=A0A9W9HU40_9EURO|nr:hypothetical protein N7492_009013 [Penicillium capsulatum]